VKTRKKGYLMIVTNVSKDAAYPSKQMAK